MTYIPKGRYLTVDQYRRKMGIGTRATVMQAIRENRLQCYWLDSKTPIIPEDAVWESKTIKSGKYIGLGAWLRGEIEHQEELKNWNLRQEQLRKLREKDDK
jgi:hypothetical protein